MEISEKNVRVSYTFYLPDNQLELDTFNSANEMSNALNEIYNRCRYQWKYNDEASEELVDFAEDIIEICRDFID